MLRMILKWQHAGKQFSSKIDCHCHYQKENSFSVVCFIFIHRLYQDISEVHSASCVEDHQTDIDSIFKVNLSQCAQSLSSF